MLEDNLFTNEPFKLSFNPDGVYLQVNYKSTDKMQVINKIAQTLLANRVLNYDNGLVSQAVEAGNGQTVKISNIQNNIKTNSNIVVKITLDKMKASIVVTPNESKIPPTSSEITDQLRAKGVVYGIDYGIISTFVNNIRYNETVDVAFGTRPTKGNDGTVELYFDVKFEKKPTILEDGSVDFRELNYISGVTKGQVLAKIIPPKSGIDGKNVNGATIRAQMGKPMKNPKGKNVELVNNTDIVSNADGYVSYIDGKINVMDVLEIPGNVDISTGNIRFNGNVIVKGNVLTDFVIEASGNVEVYGTVEGATIKADGDIILKRGIQGLGKAKLISGQDILARFIEHCTVSASNNIKTESIMHSNVNCGGNIELVGRKGLIVGGNIKVGKDIIAVQIGSHMSTPTNIEIGIDPGRREKYKELKDRLCTCATELMNTQKSIGVLRQMESRNTITMDKKILLGKLIEVEDNLKQEVEALKIEIDEMDHAVDNFKGSRIKVRKIIYPGVKLAIGSASKYIKDAQQNAIFLLDGAEIRTIPFE